MQSTKVCPALLHADYRRNSFGPFARQQTTTKYNLVVKTFALTPHGKLVYRHSGPNEGTDTRLEFLLFSLSLGGVRN